MNDAKRLYRLWLEKTADDPEIQNELRAIKDDDAEILDRFYRNLEFGTGGLRGVLGAGSNRMNKYTVRRATQGLADYLKNKFGEASVAVGYDSRINSDVFAGQCAETLAGNGIKTYIFPRLAPTPLLSFAVTRLKCKSGIVITASHNPSKYNGYKCYDPAGYQATDKAALEIYSYILKVDTFDGVKRVPFDEGIKNGLIERVSDELIEEFYSLVMKTSINPGLLKDGELKIVYTPLNGTGNVPVRTVLSRAGLKNAPVVPEQEAPDGNFPTCPYPNPEIRQVFELGLKLAKKNRADLTLATDPDCDRVGAAVLSNGEYVLLSGNEVGVLLADYRLSELKKQNRLPENPVIVKSIVSTPLVDRVAEKYGAKVVDVLTGFKYIGEYIANLEKSGGAGGFVMGFEESYGYLVGTHARDKDGVSASLAVCEAAAYYKKRGKTLVDALEDIYAEFGFYVNKSYNFVFEGASGTERMKEIMDGARRNPPREFAGFGVEKIEDFYERTITDVETGEKTPTTLPRSDVISYILSGGNSATARPSGTEPKIKVYVSARGENRREALKTAELIGEAMKSALGVK